MKYRKLREIEVSAVGYGSMGLSHGYGPTPKRTESIHLIRYAYNLGCTFFDTAEGYGAGDNEILLGEAIRPFRDKVIIATKFGGPMIDGDKLVPREYTPVEIREHCEASLRRLGTDHIDLYYQHRVSRQVTPEEVAACMGDLIREGKILGWGQSMATEAEIRRAHAVTPLTAIQSEYSIMERSVEKDIIPVCEELGIGFVPFSPLASGFLSGRIKVGNKYEGDDVRQKITRFQDENITSNQPLLELIRAFATTKNATPAQISLAWMLHKKDFIVPIPGSRNENRIRENLNAVDVELSAGEFNLLEAELSNIEIYGNRTDEDIVLGLRDQSKNIWTKRD